ncbi:phage tail tape measure protein [Acinetobacter baumannii]|nr:phage tail tape measure protein [Acinetobacter baumannii]
MATKLGTLTLDLLVRLGKFTEPLKQAEGQLKGSLTKMKGFIASYGAIAATAIGGATAAIVTMAGTMAKHNAELERFAYLSQTSVAEFQKMAVGAQMMGIEAEKLSDIMKDWNERFGDFLTAGSGPLVDFMEQVAVKTEKGADGAMKLAKELSKLSGPESMGLFVKKMEEANLSQDQMSFLMESMASDSTLLLPLLKNNAEGMRLWGEAAERAGILMDEKSLKASRELQVQTKMLDMQYEGLKKRVLSQVIPALVDISEAMLDGDEKARGMADAGKVLADSLRGVAAIAIGVWAALNMVANGISGVTSQALDSYELTNKAAEQGSWFDKLPGVKLATSLITAGATSSAENSHIKRAARDNEAVVEDLNKKWTKLFDDTVSQATAKLGALQNQANTTNTAVTQGAKDWLDKQNKVNEALKTAAAAQAELKRIAEEQKRIRESMSYEFADREFQMQLDYERQLKDIRFAFEGEQEQRFLESAKKRHETEKDLYLAKLAFELSEYRLTEEEKLNFQYALDQKEIAARTDITDQDKAAFYKAAREKHEQSMAWMRLESAQRLNDAQSAFQTDMQNITAKYEFEREQIRLNKSLSSDEKAFLIGASYKTQDLENDDSRRQAWMNYQDAFGLDTSPDEEASRRGEALKNAFEWQLITQEEYQDKLLDSERKYHAERAKIGLEANESFFGSMVDMLETAGAKQKGIYKAMFAANKAFAIAQSLISIQQGIAQAAANPFPYNLAAMASVAAATASIVANIKSVADVGFATGGYTGNMGTRDIAGVVHGQEYVLNASATKRIGVDTLNALNSGGSLGSVSGDGPTVNVYTLPGQTATATQNDDGSLDIRIQQVAEQTVATQLANPNSRISKTMQQNYNAQRRR